MSGDHSKMTWGQWWRHIWADHAKGYRTLIFNWLIVLGFGLAEVFAYLGTVNWREFVPEVYAPWVVVGIGVINILLRRMTTGPVGEK